MNQGSIQIAASKQLRIEQLETVNFETNINPFGPPDSVKRAILEHIDSISAYPVGYYENLKSAIARYCGCNKDHIVTRSSTADLIRLFIGMQGCKRVLLPYPQSPEYERSLNALGVQILNYELREEDDFRIDPDTICNALVKDVDAVVISNPGNPSSQLLSRDEIKVIADAAKATGTLLIIDEMYMEFTENAAATTAIPIAESMSNVVVTRSASKFFAVPGLRLAYAITSDDKKLKAILKTAANFSISSITAAACTSMFTDDNYVERTRSQMHTERNLVYAALATYKELRLFKPYANFMMLKVPDEAPGASEICESLRTQGMILRNCSNIRGLSNRYIRFCFMNPRQNDALVNALLEMIV